MGKVTTMENSAVRNSDLFNEIADILDFKPELYDQETWGDSDGLTLDRDQVIEFHGGENNVYFVAKSEKSIKVKECDTTACIAGWASLLSGWHPLTRIMEDPHRPGSYHCELEYGRVANKKNIPHNFQHQSNVEWIEEENHWTDHKGTIMAESSVVGLNFDEAAHLFDGKMEVEADDLRMIGKPETNIFEYGECADCGSVATTCGCYA